MLIVKRLLVLIIMHHQASGTNISTFSNEIVNFGKEKILRCDQLATYWKRGQLDIFDGHVITKRYNEAFEVDNTTFNNDLKIKRITFEEAGEYSCMATDIGWTSLINVVVIGDNITCNLSSSNFQTSLQASESFIINCSITFNASDSCEVKPLWTEKLSNKNLTSEISSGYNDGDMWLTANGNNGLKNAIFWLRVVFTCNVSAIYINDWKVVESIYDTKYISPEIKFSTDSSQLDEYWILVVISVVLLLLSLCLIIFIIHGKYRTNTEEISSIRNMPLPSIPEIRRFIRNSLARSTLINQRRIEEPQMQPYSTSLKLALERKSSRTKGRSGKSTKANESGISEYNLQVSSDQVNNFKSIYDLQK